MVHAMRRLPLLRRRHGFAMHVDRPVGRAALPSSHDVISVAFLGGMQHLRPMATSADAGGRAQRLPVDLGQLGLPGAAVRRARAAHDPERQPRARLPRQQRLVRQPRVRPRHADLPGHRQHQLAVLHHRLPRRVRCAPRRPQPGLPHRAECLCGAPEAVIRALGALVCCRSRGALS
jgi:hypothetical protein